MNLISKICLGSAFLLTSTSMLTAQKAPTLDGKVPMDPNVRTGKLANGLTYYVRHNEEPKDRASFYIVQNVGAILENDAQNGLAHFLEHMAFNGTKNFPGKGVLNYLEKYGVAFGRNINAYTSTDETVYNLSDVPTTNANLLDSALLVLHDWSNYLSLEGEEIDSERGVIHEEWRTRRSGNSRVRMEKNKLIYQGSKYAKRDVIGDLDVIDNFDHKIIREFYHDWYRTDLQAIIVVGDVDAVKFEAKIKALFAHIPAVKNPKTRTYFDVPGNKEPIVGVITDPETNNVSFDIIYKHNATPLAEKDMNYYRGQLISNLYSSILGNRLNELLQKGDAPFINGFAAYYNREVRLDIFHNSVTLKENNILGGIEVMLSETERANQHGVVKTELERAKVALLSRVEKQYKERNKQHNDDLVYGYQSNFLTNEPVPGIAFEYDAMQKLLPGITAEEVNAVTKKWMTKENIVITLTAPEKEGLKLPSNEELLAVVAKVKQKQLKPYVDEVITEPLISEMPKAGKVVKESKLELYGATEWTLSNGAKVIIKPTDFKENQILFQAFSKGGKSLYDIKDLPSADLTAGFAASFGIGNFDQTSLKKLLTGKQVRLSPYIGELTEGLSGNSSVQDFETLLQLAHLYFEKPRFDKEAFTALKSRYSAYVANMDADINKTFRDSVSLVKTDHNPRTILFNTKMIDQLDFETMKRIYKDRIADASDFTFVFVGNIDAEKAKSMIETYLGSIKNIDRKENWKDNGVDFPKEDVFNHFDREMKTPKTTIHIDFHGDIKYTKENSIMMDVVAKLLGKRYLEVIREKEGGSYGVSVWANVEKFPRQEYSLSIRFDTDPAKADKLKGIVYKEIQNLLSTGVKADDLNETLKNFIKQHQESLRKNTYWVDAINSHYVYEKTMLMPEAYEEMINSITGKQVEKFAKKYLSKPAKLEVVMSPKQ